MPDTLPPPPTEKLFSRSTLTAAVILSLLLGTIGGGVAGAVVTGRVGSWFSRESTTSASSTSGTNATLQVEEESATIDVVQKAQGSVVSIVATKDLSKVYNQRGRSFSPFEDFFGFSVPQVPNGEQEVSSGTGFIMSADGYIVTNKHVVEDDEADYTVILNTDQRYDATVLATDPVNDLAVVKIDAKDLTPLEFGDSSTLQTGQTVIAIGNALGYRNTVTKGVVSGLARRVTAGNGQSAETLEDVIQTDAAINFGNSGGPLLNLAGQVVGVNTAVSQEGQLIGFAIPVSQAKIVFDSVKATGKVVRPYLGVRYVPVTKALQESNKLTVDYGVLIQRGTGQDELAIIPGSPADKAGLQENDIILEIDGVKLDDDHSLAGQIQKHVPGDTISLKVLSKGEEKTIRTTLEEYT